VEFALNFSSNFTSDPELSPAKEQTWTAEYRKNIRPNVKPEWAMPQLNVGGLKDIRFIAPRKPQYLQLITCKYLQGFVRVSLEAARAEGQS
jgi:hypothetical protein